MVSWDNYWIDQIPCEAELQREDANALTVTPEALDDFFARFDPSAGEEEVIVHTGDMDALVTALSEAR